MIHTYLKSPNIFSAAALFTRWLTSAYSGVPSSTFLNEYLYFRRRVPMVNVKSIVRMLPLRHSCARMLESLNQALERGPYRFRSLHNISPPAAPQTPRVERSLWFRSTAEIWDMEKKEWFCTTNKTRALCRKKKWPNRVHLEWQTQNRPVANGKRGKQRLIPIWGNCQTLNPNPVKLYDRL